MEPLVIVGVDIGQKVDPTAVCVCEVERREVEPSRMEFPKRGGLFESNDMIRIPAKVDEVYVARHVGRLPLGTSYPDIARHIAELVESLVKRGISRPRIIVDSTGVGAPVVDILREALKGRSRDLIAATFTHGDKYTQNDESHQRQGSTASVGKAYLVSRLQALLQTNRLKLPKTPETEALAKELKEYEIRIDQDANDKYGAFKVGTHDDLVTALGLTVVYRKPLSRQIVFHRGLVLR